MKRDALFVAGAFVVALAFRLLPFEAATQGGLRLLSPDAYGHLRRSASVTRSFPHVPFVDSYLNHPDGAVWIWPPAFDLVVGGLTRLAYGREASLFDVAAVSATVPPLLGALHVVPLFFLARLVLSRRRALGATAAYAVLPSAVFWSSFGHADHHVLETLLLLLFLWAAAATARRPTPWGAALAGALLGLALLTWQGAVFVAGLALPWAALAFAPTAPILGAAAFLVAGAGTWLSLAGQPVPFSFVSFGWFQPVLVAALTVPVAAWALTRGPRRLVPGLILLASVAAAVPNAPRLLGAVSRGSAHLVTESGSGIADDFADGGYLSYPPEMLRLIGECRPLLSSPYFSSLKTSVGDLSPGLLLLPLALFFWARTGLRAQRRGRILLVVFGGALLVMTLLQRRNVYYLGVFTALALAETVSRVRPRALRPAVLAGVLAAVVVVPGFAALKKIRAYAGAPGSDLLDLMSRLRLLDPPPVDPAISPELPPGTIPGVMPPWSMGHFVTALAERPAAADPNAYGWRRHCRLYTTPDDAEALQILSAARCRYVITADLRSVLPAYAAVAGRGGIPLAATFSERIHRSTSRNPAPFLTLALDSRTGSRSAEGRFQPQYRIWRVTASPAAAAPSSR